MRWKEYFPPNVWYDAACKDISQKSVKGTRYEGICGILALQRHHQLGKVDWPELYVSTTTGYFDQLVGGSGKHVHMGHRDVNGLIPAVPIVCQSLASGCLVQALNIGEIGCAFSLKTFLYTSIVSVHITRFCTHFLFIVFLAKV